MNEFTSIRPAEGARSGGGASVLRASLASAVLAALVVGCGQSNEYVEPPPPEVFISKPSRRTVTDYLEYTGTAQASAQVALRARVRGFLEEIGFRDGDLVKEGQLLFVIDEEPFQVRLEQAKAKRAEAESALARAEKSKAREIAQAQVELSQSQQKLALYDVQRSRLLQARNSVTKEELDRAEAGLSRWDAQVNADLAALEQANADFELNILSAKSALAAAKAEERNAEIDLGYCRVAAPISGRINARQFDVGNYVGDGQSDILATIVRVDPIYAFVAPTESDLTRVRTLAANASGANLAEAGIAMEMGIGEEEGYPFRGVVDYLDPTIDTGTGTGRLRATFPNPEGAVAPGIFIRVRIPVARREGVFVVPDRAVGSDQGGPFVLVVGEGDKVERRAIKPGDDVGTDRVIESGVGPDDRIVVEGLMRARPGLQVAPKPVAAPPEAASPAAAGRGSDRSDAEGST